MGKPTFACANDAACTTSVVVSLVVGSREEGVLAIVAVHAVLALDRESTCPTVVVDFLKHKKSHALKSHSNYSSIQTADETLDLLKLGKK